MTKVDITLSMRKRAAASSADRPRTTIVEPFSSSKEGHDIFLNSNWTDDEKLWAKAQEAYSGSIGGWKEEVDDQNVVNAYFDFRDRKIKELAEEFLHEHDIQPIWR